MNLSTRLTRGLLSVAAAFCLTLASTATMAHENAYKGTSVQLWSVRDAVDESLKDTLKGLSDMGFDAVELAGNFGEFGRDAEALKAYLDKQGLAVSGAHVGFDQLGEDNFDETVAFYKTLGAEWLIIPADGRAWTDEGIKQIVADLNRMAEKLAPHGMQIGYHNHQDEFNAYQDSTYWEYMADNTSDEVIMQLDISWAYFAGMDPAALIERYDDRVRTVHVKAQVAQASEVQARIDQAEPGSWGEKMGLVFAYLNEKTDADNGLTSIVGQDLVDWSAVLDALHESPEPAWLVVEQEVYPGEMSSMEAVAESKAELDALLENQ